jgi:hypothetical protein
MEHKTLEQIREVADVRRGQPLSRRERLERWAEALERLNGARIRSLVRTEYVPREERDLMRIDNSPLSIAFEDPVLRAEGLKSDKLGDCTTFFGLSESEMHYIVCYCHYGETMSSEEVARRIRATARQGDGTTRAGAHAFVTLGSIAAVAVVVISAI